MPLVAISIQYIYHPIAPLGPDPQADITTPEKEEILLSPIRMPKLKSPALKWSQTDSSQFDPNTLTADKVTVEIEIGSSILFAYGTILRNFINLKENIFGEDQAFTDMSTSNLKASQTVSALSTQPMLKVPTTTAAAKEEAAKSISESSVGDDKPKRFDPRLYRPLEVTVSFTIHDIQAHIVKVSRWRQQIRFCTISFNFSSNSELRRRRSAVSNCVDRTFGFRIEKTFLRNGNTNSSESVVFNLFGYSASAKQREASETRPFIAVRRSGTEIIFFYCKETLF